MKIIMCTLLLVFLLSCSANNFAKDFLTFQLRLAESEPDSNLKKMNFYNSDLQFFVYDSVFLTNKNITSAEVIDRHTRPKIKVTLNEEGRKNFADFTLKNIGKNAAIIVDGKLVSAPKINDQITQGMLIIVGFFDQKEAQQIARAILPKD